MVEVVGRGGVGKGIYKRDGLGVHLNYFSPLYNILSFIVSYETCSVATYSRQTTEKTEYILLDSKLELEREMLVLGEFILSADGINTIIYNSKMFLLVLAYSHSFIYGCQLYIIIIIVHIGKATINHSKLFTMDLMPQYLMVFQFFIC